MHSQAQLIQHLQAIKAAIIGRTASYSISEGCICVASAVAVYHDESHPLHAAVKQMVSAEFTRLGRTPGSCDYLYPIRPTDNSTYPSYPSGYYGTPEDVAAGKVARLELIDRWTADANKKLLAAVFRKALDTLEDQQFMCNAIKLSVCTLEDGDLTEWWKHTSSLLSAALEVLKLFKPMSVEMGVGWYITSSRRPHTAALRRAILNLCITEVTRGFK